MEQQETQNNNSEQQSQQSSEQQSQPGSQPGSQPVAVNKTPLYIYIAYLSSFIVGLTFLVAGIWAFVEDKEGLDEFTRSHLKNAKTIFVWGTGFFVLAMLTTIIFIGYFILIGQFIWVLYRVIKGLSKYNKGEAYS
jgi:uncharacterized membrane protein